MNRKKLLYEMVIELLNREMMFYDGEKVYVQDDLFTEKEIELCSDQ